MKTTISGGPVRRRWSSPARQALPYPRRGAATTSAPPSRATRAVPSVEPLSATTTRRTGGRGRPASTSGSEASSLSAGMTTSMVRSLDTGGFYAMLLRPGPRAAFEATRGTIRMRISDDSVILRRRRAVHGIRVRRDPSRIEPSTGSSSSPRQGKPLPYTIEVPRGLAGAPGRGLSPASGSARPTPSRPRTRG